MSGALVIWWTTQADCEAIGDTLPTWCPDYLATEYRSRLGRPGRCRLWAAEEFGNVSARFDDETPTAIERYLEKHSAGGIVMRADEVSTLAYLPGLVTDMHLARWAPPAGHGGGA